MSAVTAAVATTEVDGTMHQDLDNIWEEELLRNMWQQAEDFGEKRRIRARMYRLRELRLREMIQNDEESLGVLGGAGESGGGTGGGTTETSSTEAKPQLSAGSAAEDDQLIDDRIKRAGQDRGPRYHRIKDQLDTEADADALVTITKQSFTIQDNTALAAEGYLSLRNKETRDSISPSRIPCRRQPSPDDEARFTSDDELAGLSENETVTKSFAVGKDGKVIKSEIPIRTDSKSRPQARSPSPKKASPSPTRSNLSQIAAKMDASLSDEYGRLNSYLNTNVGKKQIIVKQNEEEMIDDGGNKVKMSVLTTKDRDGKVFTTTRTARTTKIVDNESDIDEILIGNPDHEILERDVTEELTEDGSKIKIITETRRRPDGIEYTTKNVLKTSKIFDYDHPEDIDYCEHDKLLSTNENEETDEQGITIRTVIEIRQKSDGTEYTTKKVFKTSKVCCRITPSDDDEIIDTKESEERDEDGNVTRIVIETRRTSGGEEYTHRQVFKCRRMTLTGVELQKGMPMMDNDDEVLTKNEKKEKDEHGAEITIVTETRRRKDGTKYTFDYILRSFKGSEAQVKSMPVRSTGTGNIQVSEDDELLKEDVKEEIQKDGSNLKTIIERRRTKDGTEYLRHRIMRIPKIQEPVLTVGSMNDEVLEENENEEVEYNGIRIKSVTERRRSSLTGLQYTLRRMSKTFQQTRRLSSVPGDKVLDENVTEEEADDGTLIKTIIRRHQRRDGCVYTTHNVTKAFTGDTQVVLEDEIGGELIDQTMDQKETDDGYVIKTVLETYQRADGIQYTIERTEKTNKSSDSVMLTTDYPKQVELIIPSSDDVTISQEVEEKPNDEGQVVKTITEVRQRSNGTRYTTKTTMTILPALVAEQETSYIIIKPEDAAESDLLPSLDDELVYTRNREEDDDEGNPIPVVIETRKCKKTGEMYNITKRVFTTDVLLTDKGEQVLNRKAPKKTTPTGVTDNSTPLSKNNLISKDKKEMPKEKEVTRQSRPTTSRRKVDHSNDRTNRTTKTIITTSMKEKPSLDIKVRVGKNGATIEEINAKNIRLDNRFKSSATKTTKTDDAKREVSPRKKIVTDASKSSSSQSSSPEKSPVRQAPSTRKTTSVIRGKRADTLVKDSDVSNKSTRRPSSPLGRSSPLPSRDATEPGVRHCCSQSPSSGRSSPVSAMTTTRRPTLAKAVSSTKEKDSPKMNGEVPPNSRRSPPESRRPRPSDTFDSPRKTTSTKAQLTKSLTEKGKKTSKEPIVSLPQTPMVEEETKVYPTISDKLDEPKIEDVSSDPNLPKHKIHRPSLVREPSEYNGQDQDAINDLLEMAKMYDNEEKKTQEKSATTLFTESNKVKSAYAASELSDKLVDDKTPTKTTDLPRRGTGKVSERYRKFDRDEEVKSRKISLEMRDSVSLKRSIFERDDSRQSKESTISPRKRPESYADKKETSSYSRSYENRTPVVEPLITPKYFHPLGGGDEVEKPKKRPSLDAPCEMTSPKLIMRLTSQDKTKDKPKDMSEVSQEPPSHKLSHPEMEDRLSVSRDLNGDIDKSRRRSETKEYSPAPSSKEGTPTSGFSKEGSPSRFVTGRPIDQGANAKKIKKLERSLSGKVTYEDLEMTRSQLPSYLERIDSIMDMSTLESMLEHAETYEERRVIRGQVRHVKKLPGTPTATRLSSTPVRRFNTAPKPATPDPQSTTKTNTAAVETSKTNTAAVETSKSLFSSTDDTSTSVTTSTRLSSLTETTEKTIGLTNLSTKMSQRTQQEPAHSDTTLPLSSAPRKSSDTTTTAPTPSKRRQSKSDDQSPPRSSAPDKSRDRKEPKERTPTASAVKTEPLTNGSLDHPADTPKPRTGASDRLTAGSSRRITSRKASDDELKLSKTSKSTFSRRDTGETKVTSTSETRKTEVAEVKSAKEMRETKTTTSSIRRDSGDKKTLLTRKNISDSKVTVSRSDSGDSKSILSRRDSGDKKSSTRRETSDTRPTTKSITDDSKTPLNKRRSDDQPKSKVQPKGNERVTPSTRASLKPSDKSKQPGVSEIFIEPLMHQKAMNQKEVKRLPSKQSNVEKIVSPYGVGPTDENGQPLFGLSALKRKNKPRMAEPGKGEDKGKEVERTDSTGKPLFGVKSLRTSTSSTTKAKEATASTATSVTAESVQKVSSSSSITTTSTVRKTSRNEDEESLHEGHSCSSSSSSSAHSSPAHSDNEEEEDHRLRPEEGSDNSFIVKQTGTPEPLLCSEESSSSLLVKNTRDVLGKKSQTVADEAEVEEEEGDEEVIMNRSQPLKDIIKLHEKKVKESEDSIEESPRPTPKQKLRSNFEPSPGIEIKTAHKTWDVESDLSTRTMNMKNIISRHEKIAKEPEEAEIRITTATKKLTGILKKTSTSSVTEAQYATSTVSATTVDTNDFMENLTEDQITKLSEEFDRRAQDDGIINGGDAAKPGKKSRSAESPEREMKRKTSYTEITLKQPASKEGDSQHLQTASKITKSSYTTTTTGHNGVGPPEPRDGRSFLQDRSKVTGFGDVMERMAATQAVDGTATGDDEARSLLNRFLGAQVLLTGVESMMQAAPDGRDTCGEMVSTTVTSSMSSEEKRQVSTGTTKSGGASEELVQGVDLNSVTDEHTLRKLLDSCNVYEDRYKVRQRLKTLVASVKGVPSGTGVGVSQSVSSKRGGGGVGADSSGGSTLSNSLCSSQGTRTVTESHSTTQAYNQKSSFSSSWSSSQSTKSSKVSSPFNKFQQLDAQQQNARFASKKGGADGATDNQLFALSKSLKNSATSIKETLLFWCQCRTRAYKGIKIDNFSTSWNDGMAFCALIHHFYPDAFDFDELSPKNRRYNFSLAFRIADELADVMPLLDVDDMVMMKKPDWKCVFTYIQSLYKTLK